MSELVEQKTAVIYHLDDNETTLEIARDFFRRNGVVYVPMRSSYEAYKVTESRMPTLVLISTTLKDMQDLVKKNCFPTLSVLCQSRPGLNIVTIAREYRQDDLIDTQREGGLELVEFSLEGLERVLEIANKIVVDGGPCGTQQEITNPEQKKLHADGGTAMAISGVDNASDLQDMIYQAVRKVLDDVLGNTKRSTPIPSASRQMTAYQYH